jgi:hypothetical protein
MTYEVKASDAGRIECRSLTATATTCFSAMALHSLHEVVNGIVNAFD